MGGVSRTVSHQFNREGRNSGDTISNYPTHPCCRYDLRGLRTKARFDSLAGEGVTTQYDGFGRSTSSTLAMAGTSRAIGHFYDGDGNRVRVTHPDTGFFTYGSAGRPGRPPGGGGQRPFFCRCLSRSRTMLLSPSGIRPRRRATS